MTDKMEEEFDLGRFRYKAATYLKFIIQAMAREKKSFFTQKVLRDWQVEDLLTQQKMSVARLLDAAFRAYNELDEFIGGGSGEITSAGILPDVDEDQYRIIDNVMTFVFNPPDLKGAAGIARRGKKINLESLANWSALGRIRQGLDSLPHPRETPKKSELEGKDPPANSAVVLGKTPTDPIWLLGERVDPITPARYRCVQILLDAAPARLTAKKIRATTILEGYKVLDPRCALVALSKLGNWSRVLLLPEGKGSGYGIRKEFS